MKLRKLRRGTIVYALGFYNDWEYRRARVVDRIYSAADWSTLVTFLEGPHTGTSISRPPECLRTVEEHLKRMLVA